MKLNLADPTGTLLALHGLGEVDSTHLRQFLDKQPQRDLVDGERICAEGEATECMWILVEGAVAVQKRNYQGVAQALPEVGAPALLGHMGMVDGQPRSATCTAHGKSRVIVLSQPVFQAVMADPGPAGDLFRRLLIAGMNRQLASGNAELRRLLHPEEVARRPAAVTEEGLVAAEASFEGWKGHRSRP